MATQDSSGVAPCKKMRQENADDGALATQPSCDSTALLAVVHSWLRNPALGPAKELLVSCLFNHGQLERLGNDQEEGGRFVQVEWAFSGKPLPGRLSWPECALSECAAWVTALQTEVAQMLDKDNGNSAGTTLPQNVRLFAGHGGPELTWPDLAWYPDKPACPPPDTAKALKLLSSGGVVLVATRGDFGTKMLEVRATSKVSNWAERSVSLATTTLEITYQRLTGSIPTELGKLINMKYLCLHGNKLGGSIPTEFGELINLIDLNLSLNELSEPPRKKSRLRTIQRSVKVKPSSFARAGSIPTEFGKLINMKNLELWENKLSGSIPTEFGELINLTYLSLHNNNLSCQEEFKVYLNQKVPACDVYV